MPNPRNYTLVRYAGQKWRQYLTRGSWAWIERGGIKAGVIGQWTHIRLLAGL